MRSDKRPMRDQNIAVWTGMPGGSGGEDISGPIPQASLMQTLKNKGLLLIIRAKFGATNTYIDNEIMAGDSLSAGDSAFLS
jgi:hypothetical protein